MNATERDLRLFIVRHGESLANIKGILESRNDSPLSDDGQKQATMLAEKLKDYNWLKVFSSPRLRATTTAEKVAGSVKVETIDELLEMDIPLWEGLTWKEISERYPIDYKTFHHEPEHYAPAQGERFQDVDRRTSRLLQRLQSEFLEPRGAILLVTHSVIVNMMLISAKQMPISSIWSGKKIENASVSILRWNGQQYKLELEAEPLTLTE